MQYSPPLVEGRLIRRYKRFLADVRLGDEIVVAHCPNSGAMTGCAPADAPVWLTPSDNPKRKLKWTWELVRLPDGTFVNVHSARANAFVEEALEVGAIPELAGYTERRREVRYDEGSRIDVLLSRPDAPPCYVEVKSVTLGMGDGVSAFPDAVTARGRKHVEALQRRVEAGDRAVLFFCAARTDTVRVRPADEIDPTYGAALRAAAAAGVEVLAYVWDLTPEGVRVRARIPVEL